jgi:hypothetical protein
VFSGSNLTVRASPRVLWPSLNELDLVMGCATFTVATIVEVLALWALLTVLHLARNGEVVGPFSDALQ